MAAPSEEQLRLARSLGVKNPERLSPTELYKAIDNSPATAEQMSLLKSVMRYLNYGEPPAEATFKQAGDALSMLVPTANDVAIRELGIEVNDVIFWAGDTYIIVGIERKRKTVFIRRVELTSGEDGQPAQVERTLDTQQKHYPLTLLERDAHKIDLTTWRG
ncbi:MAG TPA: hypothetical protein VLA88_06185 [Candidatus Saccharimonadales bacterium]|nr:hypothetical protein [Candidatus Saccharimonadales bacterium]